MEKRGKMKKKGSHVGMIASFGIFIMFLVGIYFILSPVLKTQKDKELLLEYLELKLKEEFSSNLTTATLSNCSWGGTGSSSPHIYVQNVSSDPNYIVKDKTGNILGADLDSSTGILQIDPTTEDILWIYFSYVNFTTSAGAGGPTHQATIESIRINKEIFEKKILDGINNFDNLKGNLSIPDGSNFGLIFEMNNKTQISAGNAEVSTNVYVKEALIQYIDKDANTLSGKLIIRVW